MGSASQIQALMFDVFGTLVDWRGSITRQLNSYFSQLAQQEVRATDIDWNAFALDWRSYYQPSMQSVRDGSREFVVLDILHRESLLSTLEQYRINELSDAQIDQLVLCWHTLDAWPDVTAAMHSLRPHYRLAALSNGNSALLKNLSEFAELPWHVSLGAEPCRTYKPQPRAYVYSAQMLALDADQCMMVAAHNDDLQAARELGFRTAYINRPTEYGERQVRDIGPESNWDFSVESLAELSALLLEEQINE